MKTMDNAYPIRAVAKMTGISVDTLRGWERRYQAVIPERSQRGRIYKKVHIERLLLLNQLVLAGHAIGGIAPLTDQELKGLLAHQPCHPAPEPPKDILAPVLSAIESFDSARAGDELRRLAAVLAPRDVVYQIALPLLREVGVRWHKNNFMIAQEHLVSQLLHNLLGGMMSLFRPSKADVKVVFATPAGDSHEFGILAAAVLASMAGIEPVYLGPDLPARDIAEAAHRTSARVILLGITMLKENTVEEVRAIAAAMPEGGELWIGCASSPDLDLMKLPQKIVLLKDFEEFENECRRWRN